ncbi:MAG: PDZ domain-containing protein [Saprospiraceae bacterium]|nr:PDZ domain-containing protein [Saprospiraceae bacterium]
MSEQIPKHLKWLPFVIGLSAAIGMYGGYRLQLPKKFREQIHKEQFIPNQKNQNLYDVLNYLESKYVDSIDQKENTDFLIQQLCFALDPYTEYLKASEFSTLKDDIDGSYKGVGLSFTIINDQVFISSVVSKGPSAIVGLEPGDLVMEINQKVLLSHNIHLDSIANYLRSNSDVCELLIKKSNEAESRIVKIIKTEIYNKSISASKAVNENTFYIKIDRFSEKTYREFMMIIEDYVQNKKLKNLILDLRDNSGGVLDASADILNQLLTEPNTIMFTTVDRNKKEKKYQATGKPFFRLGKIVVLINSNTASAAEVVAGSLQDLSRAKIYGVPSFGKATVLELYPLSDGSSLEMSSARIKLPSGRCIQKAYDVSDDSSLNWLSKFKPDTTEIHFGNKILANGKGVIPDVISSIDERIADTLIIKIATNFVIQYFQEIKAIREKKNSKSLLETLILKKVINLHQDKFILKNKNEIIQEIQYKILRLMESEEQERLEILKTDPWIDQAVDLINTNK